MQVGDLVMMPHSYSRDSKPELGVVVDLKDYSDPRNTRICVYWFDYQEKSWEPIRWLKVLNENR